MKKYILNTVSISGSVAWPASSTIMWVKKPLGNPRLNKMLTQPIVPIIMLNFLTASRVITCTPKNMYIYISM